jgi:hypothetical protein
MVAPLDAGTIASALLAPPLLLPAQPPSEQAETMSSAATPARSVDRLIRNDGVDASLIIGSDIVKID